MIVNSIKPNLKTVLTLKSRILEYTRDWLNSNCFVEVQGPVLFPSFGNEAKHNHFMVDYFGQSAFLGAGLAPYSDKFLSMFDKVYTVAPTFRAEKVKSKRHLAEYWRIEAFSKVNFEEMLTTQENLLSHLLRSLKRNCQKELTQLQSPIDNLTMKTPFPRLTYDEAIEKLQKASFNVTWGEPILKNLEITLTNMYNQPFFITNYPLTAETVLNRTLPDESMLTYSADLLAPQGYGEIGACHELITQKAVIKKRLTELEVNSKDLKWYLDTKKNTFLPQSMISIGLERLLQWVCNCNDIAMTVAVPRQYGKELF